MCDDCLVKGRKTIYPQLEPCERCIENNISCRKNVIMVVALDCFSGNRYLIEKFQEQKKRGNRDPELFLTEPIGEVVHVLKTIKSTSSNWYILTPNGTLYNLSMLRTLRDGNGNKDVSNKLRKVIQRNSVVNRDRQDTDCLIEFSMLGQVLLDICQTDPVVVHQVVPDKYKLEATNKPGDLGVIVSIGALNINHVAVLYGNQNNSYSVSVLELHYPVRISKLIHKVENVSSIDMDEGMCVFATNKGLKYIEIVKGTVLPRVPAKKVDLKNLCEDLNLDTGGKVVDLRARLKKFLDPKLIMNSEDGNLILNSESLKNSIISKYSSGKGCLKFLVAALNEEKRLCKVELRCARGEMSAVIAENAQFDEDVKIIVMIVIGVRVAFF